MAQWTEENAGEDESGWFSLNKSAFKENQNMSLAKTVLTLGCKIMGVKAYCEDALLTTQNHEFIEEPRFAKAFARGIQAAGEQYNFLRWRTHVVLWAAASASKLPGDFLSAV